MELNPKIIKLVVFLFAGALILYNFVQLIHGEHIIISLIGILVCIGLCVAYYKFSNNDNNQF